MQDEKFDVVNAFKLVLGGFSIHKADRGEFLALLLMNLACDRAVGPPDKDSRPKKRWVSLPTFFQCLFRHLPCSFNVHINIFKIHGMVVGPAGSSAYKVVFDEKFQDAKLYLNHWIKFHQHRTFNITSILGMISREGGILCGNGMPSIDFILGYLCCGGTLSCHHIGAFLGQIKNTMTHDGSHVEALSYDLVSQGP